jgi:hypothetical protein
MRGLHGTRWMGSDAETASLPIHLTAQVQPLCASVSRFSREKHFQNTPSVAPP